MINRNIADLYPPFARWVGSFLARWNKENPTSTAQIFEGIRSFDRQAELYAQGRTTPGSKVTNAMPGFSWHQYGLAVDIVFDSDPVKPGLQATWDPKLPWARLGKMGTQAFHLEWAGNWIGFPEMPHFQKTFGLQLSEAREIYEMDGGSLEAVWNALNLTRQVKLRGN
jgi:peptidoglycan L-alanyl-D-glutamate endopeptidase CwlK